MQIYQLGYFITLARTLNYTSAAEMLFVSQPTLSRIIISLEQEVGAPLFERSKQQVKLSSHGKLFLPYAERIIADYNSGLVSVRNNYADSMERIRIGVYTWSYREYLPVLLERIRANWPELRIELKDGTAAELLDDVRTGNLDLSFTTSRLLDKQIDLRDIKLFQSDTCVLVSKEHPFASLQAVTVDQLLNEHIYYLDPSATYSQVALDILNCCSSSGSERTLDMQQLHDLRLVYTLVSNNLGIALLHRRMNYHREYPNMACLRLVKDSQCPDEPGYYINGRLIYRENNKNTYLPHICRLAQEIAPDYLPPEYA